MKIIKIIREFFFNVGYDKSFMTIAPVLLGLCLGFAIFNFKFTNGLIIAAACIFFYFSIKIFDDFIDWINSNPQKRIELEQTGIRGMYSKCSHFLNNKKLPRIYFYIALIMFLTAISLVTTTVFFMNNFKILLFLIPVLLFGFIIYNKKFKAVLNFCGYEFFCAILSSVSLLFVYYAETRYISSTALYYLLIIFFFEMNILYTSSLLNYKSDLMTEKITLPIIIKNDIFKIVISGFLTMFPFVLTAIGIYFKIISLYSSVTLLLIGHAVWFIYLIYLYVKYPQKYIKWNWMMGIDEKSDVNEQNNTSWYTIRYNFLRNIFIAYIFITVIIYTCS